MVDRVGVVNCMDLAQSIGETMVNIFSNSCICTGSTFLELGFIDLSCVVKNCGGPCSEEV